MNYKTLVKGAFALSLSLIVGSASAVTTTQSDAAASYSETFDSAVVDTPISDASFRGTNPDTTVYGWLAPEGDESKIIAGGPTGSTNALQLNTDAGTLTNLFAKSVADDLNDGIDGTDGAGAYFETEVKFVPSDTPDAGIAGGQDATKFAIYAYADETDPNNATTNLVVYHKYMANGVPGYTNEIFGAVDCNVYTKLRVEMKQIDDPTTFEPVNVFSVKVGDGPALTSPLAIDGCWFLTVEYANESANMKVSSLNFKGTGEIDNIKAGVITETTEYAIKWTDSVGVTVTNVAGETLTSADTNFVAGASLYFTAEALPEGNVITNVFIDGAVDPNFSGPAATYTYTVGSADAIVTVLAGVPATPAGDDYEAGDNVGDVTGISAGMATWLNGLKTAKNMTKAQLEAAFANDHDIYTLTEEYLLNTDPTVDTTVAFNISSIAVGNTVDLQVTLTRADNETPVTAAINGELQILGATSLDGTFGNGETVEATFAGATTASKSLTTQAKFFKAVIVEKAAAPAPAGNE